MGESSKIDPYLYTFVRKITVRKFPAPACGWPLSRITHPPYARPYAELLFQPHDPFPLPRVSLQKGIDGRHPKRRPGRGTVVQID